MALLQNAMLIAGIITLLQVFTIGPGGSETPNCYGNKFWFHWCMSECCRSYGEWGSSLWCYYGSNVLSVAFLRQFSEAF